MITKHEYNKYTVDKIYNWYSTYKQLVPIVTGFIQED